MEESTKIKNIWNNLDYENSLLIKKYFEKHIDSFIEFIIAKTLEKEKYEIGTFNSFWKSGSVIRIAENEAQKKLELRLVKNNSFEIILSIKRAKEPEQTIKHKLSAEEIKLIPHNLVKLMRNIKDLKTPATFFTARQMGRGSIPFW